MLLQDQGLDVIAEGLDTLKNMAHDMNEVVFLTVSVLCNHIRFSLTSVSSCFLLVTLQ